MNETVLTLIERAGRKGVAKVYSYRGWYGEKRYTEKYRVEHVYNNWSLCPDDKWYLYHYETLTATVTNGVGKVEYGESHSDVDSIKTFLSELTGQAPEMHFYPSKDSFQVVTDGKVTQEF